MSETKFKLGAKVRVIKESMDMDSFAYTGNLGDYKKGYIGTITKIEEISEGSNWIELDKGGDIIEDLVELVEPISKFHVGDLVRCVGTKHHYGGREDRRLGWGTELIEYMGEGNIVNIDNNGQIWVEFKGSVYFFMSHNLELVEPTKFDLRNTYVIPRTPEEHKKIQQILFDNYCEWLSSGKTILDYDGEIKIDCDLTMSWGSIFLNYNKITPESILALDTKSKSKLNYESKEYKTEEKKMELKECNKKNLAEAKKKVEAERMNAEVTFAAGEYERITDRMDTLNREIKTRQEDLVEYEKQLAPFKGK